MTYRVAVHPSVHKNLTKLYRLDRSAYDHVNKRLRLLAYRPEMGNPLEAEFEGKWRIHIGVFVLIYTFDKTSNTLTLLTFEHYTRAYDTDIAYS
ncbi:MULTISPECIES: type II toxin-antitoxin system RelE/ParE family toxin [unclassified Methanosarcina]|uniref:type II toxin-antitoxin system RelE family toxin n=1 Tax=unclassified Methanosarcina TaxID=2644672 RepID=UPI000615F403|nr:MULTISPECIES: type II toxin-antitoxin system RelE/ParE family toxin [unclassified Methanosarcina]AKB18763.1 RelE/StbE replicon stabilization toxin [Methanosarcina sp. WWM596]